MAITQEQLNMILGMNPPPPNSIRADLQKGLEKGLANMFQGGAPIRNAIGSALTGDFSPAISGFRNVGKEISELSNMKMPTSNNADMRNIDMNQVLSDAMAFAPMGMAGVVSGYGKNAEKFANILNVAHPNIDADLMGNNAVTLSKIIAKTKNTGDGTSFMNDFIKLADENKVNTNLSPSVDFGGSSKNRLKDFYKRFGFVENKGKNKDFTINESMYREPQLNEADILGYATPEMLGLLAAGSAGGVAYANDKKKKTTKK